MPARAIAAIVILVIVIAIVTAVGLSVTRRRRLRKRFGPEYDRVVTAGRSRRQGEAELAKRLRRARKLDIHPLSAAARATYLQQWPVVQEQFVDEPGAAVAQAERLIGDVLGNLGYGTDNDEQLFADLSVDHAQGLQHYREARRLSRTRGDGESATEDMRQAMIDYRAMFDDLLGERGDASGAASDGGTETEEKNEQQVWSSDGPEAARARNG